MEKKKEKRIWGDDRVAEVLDILREYKEGKVSIDNKATVNQEWWRLRHWEVLTETNKGVSDGKSVGSAWAVNSLLNKHADIMDSFPKPNVLPRDADDIQEAEMLSKILPTLEEQNNAEQVYSEAGYDLLIDGTAITGVFWDNSKNDGLGDIVKTNIDVHNVFWQPGVKNIQDSKYFFNVALEDAEDIKERYPKLADELGKGGYNSGLVAQYNHDDTIDTSKQIEVIDCYYKKLVINPIVFDEEGGLYHTVQRTQVHLAKIIGGKCVFSSEDTKGYEGGYYEHGQYPFVFRALFPIKDSPCGFGYLDIMKNPQKDIDKIDQAIIKNALMKAGPRYWVRKNADVNLNDFADWGKELVEVGAGDLGDAVKQIDVDSVPGIVVTHLTNKIEELKETSGNRDFSQGATASGVTAASAIAALQEAGSKLMRDVNKTLYRAARLEYELEIELIRQFYTEDRSFRVDDGKGGFDFVSYNNSRISPREEITEDGRTRHKRAVFDVKISAEKASPFSRAAQNETAKELYQLGLFAPGNATPALVCLDMMEFEGKDRVKSMIQANDVKEKQFQQMAQLVVQTMPEAAMQMGLIDPSSMPQTQSPRGERLNTKGTAEERAARKSTDDTRTANARKAARAAAEVG